MTEKTGYQYLCNDINEAYERIGADLMDIGVQDHVDASRDGGVVAELINPQIVIADPTRVLTSPVRDMSMRYALGELMWYLAGNNRTANISEYSNSWKRLSDDGETANSAYGYRIQTLFGFDQWEDAQLRLLDGSMNSRQAVIHIKDATPITERTKDLPCTLTLQFLLRNRHLHMTVNMRSNDFWLGFPYDTFSFMAMQTKMAMELSQIRYLDDPILPGTYTHNAASLHLYKRDLTKLVEGMSKVDPV